MNLTNLKTRLIRKQKSKTDSNSANGDTKKEPKLVTSELNPKQQAKEPKILSKRPKENDILSQLTKIYDTCEEIKSVDLVTLINTLPIPIRTKNITDLLMKIVAKRTALDFSQFGVHRLPTLTRAVSAIDMLNADFESLVETEYHQIKLNNIKHSTKYYKYGENEKQCLKESLSKIIAQQSMNTDNRTELDKTLAKITEQILLLPPDQQLSTAETILNVLDQQQEAMNMWANCKRPGTDR